MGAHRTNPVAIANAVPKDTVAVIDIGDGYGIRSFEIVPRPGNHDGRETLEVWLVAIAGKVSDLYPMKPVMVPICALGGVVLADLKTRIAEAIDPPKPLVTE